MHRAPVVGIVVLDGHGAPLPEPLEVAHDLARSPDMQGSHHLLVVSEEQFKVSPLHSTGGTKAQLVDCGFIIILMQCSHVYYAIPNTLRIIISLFWNKVFGLFVHL